MNGQALGHCKLCELSDFGDADLAAVMRAIYGGGSESPEFPRGEEHRKHWEVSMSVRALRDLGALRPDAEILGVGAGREATLFWLTREVRRVFATDLYLAEDSWSATDSGARMLIEPSGDVHFGWNPRRLVVQHMNGLDLRYEDDSFDGIFSSGSIEHFGELPDIRRSVEEMYRVLKPGGVAAIATEFRLGGPPGIEGTVMFDEGELRSVLLDGMDWELPSPLDLSMSEETLATEIEFRTLLPPDPVPPTLRERIASRLSPGRQDETADDADGSATHLPTPYPHIVLHHEGRTWTSVHVALIKPASA